MFFKLREQVISRIGRLLCALIISSLSLSSASADTFTPTNTSDGTNSTTLRGAIIAANQLGGSNTIVLNGNSYLLSIPGSGEDAAITGDLDVTNGSLTIIGTTTTNVTINASALGDRVFQVHPGVKLALSNVIVTGGTAPDGSATGDAGESGGGIHNSGTLILSDCIVSGNSSGQGAPYAWSVGAGSGGDGGGILSTNTLILNRCVVSGNSAGHGGGAGSSGGNGGGIYISGNATFRACTIQSNHGGNGIQGYTQNGLFSGKGGDGGSGAGLFNVGTLELIACTISSNTAGTGGDGDEAYPTMFGGNGGGGGAGGDSGGIRNFGFLTLSNCAIHNNSGGVGGAGGRGFPLGAGGQGGRGGNGGGIENFGSATLNNCTVSANSGGAGSEAGTTDGYYGGYFTFGRGGDGGNGGGIRNAGTLNLSACTVTVNRGGAGGRGGSGRTIHDAGSGVHITFLGGGAGGSGGGVLNLTNGTSATLRNTLIAANETGRGGLGGTNNFNPEIGPVGTKGSGFDLSGDFTTLGFNLVGNGDGHGGVTNGINSDLVGAGVAPLAPLLGPLQNNGGPTFTHAPLAGSPAIDQGNSFGLTTDQRGVPRVHEYASVSNAIAGDGCDIGAVESDLLYLAIARSGSTAVLTWDANSPSCTLEFTTNVTVPASWTPATGTSGLNSGLYRFTNGLISGSKFFRLKVN